MATERPLTTDELAELEEQQGHLLGSLDDLDAELAAGDIDQHDYDTLRDDYTRRAAEVLRAIDAGKASIRISAASERSPTRRLLSIGAIVAFAAVAGFLLARSAGFRGSNDTITGDLRASTRTLILEAGDLAAQGEFDEAIARYDEVLEVQPSNAEALTYKGWYLYLSDDSPEVEPEVEALFDEAVASDPDLPDVRVFRAVLLTNQDRFDEASTELALFDASDPPPAMVQLVEAQGLRERALAGLLRTADPDAAVDVSIYEVSAETMARAGRLLVSDGEAGRAVRAYGAALDDDPDNVTALLGRGELLVVTGQQSLTTDPETAAELIADGRMSIERAIEADSSSVQARLLLIQVAVISGDFGTVSVQLAAIDELDLSEEEQRAVDALRSIVDGG